MTARVRILSMGMGLGLLWRAAGLAHAQPAPDSGFDSRIKPILAQHCVACHGWEKQKSDLRLDSFAAISKGGLSGQVISSGEPDQSRLIQAIRYDGDLKMPPKGRIPQEAIDALTEWVKLGALGPDGEKPQPSAKASDSKPDAETLAKQWAFQPIKRPRLNGATEAKNQPGIDAFIEARLHAEGLHLSREADRVTLLRRLSFDLIGLPPAYDEVRRFAADSDPRAYEKLVDRLLASPHYGERWASHWLDVVRFAETNGFETNTPREKAWPYRDWVIRALNEDMPYDRFITEQLAGDATGADAATGFLVAGPNDMVKSPDVELTRQQRADELHDMVVAASGAFLGLTVGCAKCHNHKFDPISQNDYYAMKAFFAGVQHGDREVRPADFEERMQKATRLRMPLAEVEGKLTRYRRLASVGIAALANAGDGKRVALDFEGMPHPLRGAVHPGGNVDRFTSVAARRIRFTITATNLYEPCIDELEIWTAEESPRNVALASAGAKASASGTYPNSPIHKLEHINDGLYGNSHSWISNEAGRGWVQIELPREEVIGEIRWARDREGAFKDRLATGYKIEIGTEAAGWRVVASSADRKPYAADGKPDLEYSAEGYPPEEAEDLVLLLLRKNRLESEIKSLTTLPRIYAGAMTPPEPTNLLYRGEVMQPREQIAPATLSRIEPVLSLDMDAPERERRIALARWIASPENPLTARIMVNRIWQHHFGHGLVDTTNDFGAMGARPTHPELLDWLAGEFIRSGWSMKAIHRMIVLSRTYLQSSAPNPEAMRLDAGDRLLWRYPARRLAAEQIRDAILAVSGKLDLTPGGPGFDVYQPNDNYVHVYNAKTEFSASDFRRMIYQFRARMRVDPTFGVFDCPEMAQSAPRRAISTTPLQAFNLMNGPFLMEQAQFLADRLERETGESAANQIRRAFELAYSREPEPDELNAARALAESQGIPAFCRALFNTNEFVHLR